MSTCADTVLCENWFEAWTNIQYLQCDSHALTQERCWSSCVQATRPTDLGGTRGSCCTWGYRVCREVLEHVSQPSSVSDTISLSAGKCRCRIKSTQGTFKKSLKQKGVSHLGLRLGWAATSRMKIALHRCGTKLGWRTLWPTGQSP